MYYDIIKSIVRYLYRLENNTSDVLLLKYSYTCSKNLDNGNRFSWFTFVESLLKFLINLKTKTSQ